ncbi:NlpC/P60 family protein [Solihabitans fulvus]|uniref:NlpC/P60 family protein n=1 Tax=Solihabitans fulvus TaxID=1892852 RepID=A0A5B2WSX4_9PSEU|nr:NlpC/P60 family protein [Solihabitans fulvus]KAA2252987.1 NlpC/P60 family protein [Solihabitans fulvus]
MAPKRGAARLLVSSAVALTVVLGAASTATAVPPPPPNPSDSQIDAGRADADAKAAKVGDLTNQLTQAEARLQQLSDDVEFKMEYANKMLVDLQTATDAADKARSAAQSARTEADAAGKAIEGSRSQLDDFAAASFQQGATIGSVSAYLGAKSPEDLLARAQLLAAASNSGLNALDQLERDRTDKANKDSAARLAKDVADQKEADAVTAKKAADEARAAAVEARKNQAAQAADIQNNKSQVEQQLAAAQNVVGGLEAQRAQYNDWAAAKQREEQEAARRAAEAAAAATPKAPVHHAAPAVPTRPASQAPSGGGDVETVIGRAMSQLGVRYSWGGGNASGPTVGIPDGGVADEYGDYANVGFDCSGLMVYAFAGAGIYLPKYSGYQYTSGTQVPVSQADRGDMLFWGPGGGTHVALYLGDGMMIEAPYSGSVVRVVPVRWGGIQPYAVRML